MAVSRYPFLAKGVIAVTRNRRHFKDLLPARQLVKEWELNKIPNFKRGVKTLG